MEQENNLNLAADLDRVAAKSVEFSELLKKITYATNEVKKVWREIYENAVDDRVHAYLLFAELYKHVVNNENGHTLHGKLMTSYLERMNKANDQLLKLAELMENASASDEELDAGALYDEFNSGLDELQSTKKSKK